MPDTSGPKGKKTEPRRFINEKIVKQPMTKREIFHRILALLLTAAVFGVVAAVTFVVSRPVAERYLLKETTKETTLMTISKDDPDTTPAPTQTETQTESETNPPTTEETEAIEDMLQAAIEHYSFTMENLNALYTSLRAVVSKADKGIVTVHSVRNQTDWFNNQVESSGLFSGAVIASANDELLVLTPEGAVEDADSIRVAFSDGTEAQGTIKQTDRLSGMAIVSVPTAGLGRTLLEETEDIELGNSYSVKQGDFVIAVGAPAGMVHSSSYGSISYITKNVQVTDSLTRVLYADLKGNAAAGTFLINTEGQMIGWVTDEYGGSNSGMTTAMAISDYKSILEKMITGIAFPYFGIKGQEVSAAMNETGMPLGVYVVDVAADSPAYEAGIQCGDIITVMNGEEIVTMKDFQVALEACAPGEAAGVTVLRNGRDEYKEIEYQVTIGAR